MVFSMQGQDSCDSCSSGKSHSVFIPRSITEDQALALSISLSEHFDTKDPGVSFVVKPFFMRSTHPTAIAEHFLIDNKVAINVQQDGSGDLNPAWLDLTASSPELYKSTFSMSPRWNAYGFWMSTEMMLWCGWWVAIDTALVRSQQNLNLKNTGPQVPASSSGVSTMGQAVNQCEFEHGRMSSNTLSVVGLDNIQALVGYKLIDRPSINFELYATGVLGTGERLKEQYLFTPLVGSPENAFGCGVGGRVHLLRSENHNISLLMGVEYVYHQGLWAKGSFDLCANGDWSRYLSVVKRGEESIPLPGINFFTRSVYVKSHSTLDMTFIMHYQRCAFQVEVGYNFWYRQKIRLDSISSVPKDHGIYDIAGPPYTTASTATIAQSDHQQNPVVSDSSFVEIKAGDLNIETATPPLAVSSKFFIVMAYEPEIRCKPVVFAGVSYEQALVKGAFSQVGFWLGASVELG